MEESVMLKSIHEESATVTALCAVVDACLSLGEQQFKVQKSNFACKKAQPTVAVSYEAEI